MVGSMLASCSRAMMASLAAYMQQTEEQYPWSQVMSREPTHWIQATLRGRCPSDGRFTSPVKGPEALSMRSNSRLVTTLG